MAYVHKRGKKYQGYYKLDGKQIYVATAQRKEDALRAAHEAERSARLGGQLDPQNPKTPLDICARDYLATSRGGADATREKRAIHLRRHVVPFFGSIPIG